MSAAKYITFDLANLKHAEEYEIEESANIISSAIKELIDEKISNGDGVLVVGLGNQFVTPDALGPKVVSEIEVTRHLLKYAPQYVVKGARSVCAIAPGVLGTTGIETVEIIKQYINRGGKVLERPLILHPDQNRSGSPDSPCRFAG